MNGLSTAYEQLFNGFDGLSALRDIFTWNLGQTSLSPISQILEAAEDNGLWRGTKSLKRGEFLKIKRNIGLNIYTINQGVPHAYTLDGQEELTIRFNFQKDLLLELDSHISTKPLDL